MPVHGGGLSDTGTDLSLSAVISLSNTGVSGSDQVVLHEGMLSVLLWEK